MDNPMDYEAHTRLGKRIAALPRIAGVTAISVGAIVFVGWTFDLPLLKSVHPNLVAMKANAALAFILAGTSLLLMHSSAKRNQMKRVAQSLALFVIVIGLLTSIEYAFDWNIGIDQLLFNELPGAAGTLQGGRMPFSAALSFVFFGTAILVLELRTRRGNMPGQILAMTVGFLGVLGLLGYIYYLPEFVGYAVHTHMAAHGAVTFIALSIGVLALKPDEGIMGVITGAGPGGFMARRLLPAAVGMPVVIGWLTTEGESLGLYGNQFGEVIAAAAYIAFALVLVWRTGRSLNKLDIERKRVSHELLESEKHFKELFDNAPAGYHELDAEGRIVRINQTELRTLGYRADEMLGHFVWEFVTNQEESRQAVTAKLSGALPPARGVERIFLRKDGTTITVVIEDRLLRDDHAQIIGIRTTLQDVTELKRAQELLHETEERHRTVLENLAEGVGIVDEDERFRFANPAAETIFGVPAGTLVGRSLREFMDPVEFEKMVEQTINRQKGEISSYEMQFTRPGGEKRDLLVTACPFPESDGNLVGTIGVFRDLTEQKRAQRLTGALYSISQAIHSTDDLDELFEHIHRDISNIMAANNFFIALLSDDGKTLHFPYDRDETGTDESSTIDVDNPYSLTVEVLQSKRALLLDEKELHNRYSTGRNKVWGSAPKCWLGVPLILSDKAIGVMVVQDYKRGGVYGQKEVGLFEMASGQIAIAIERKRTEQKLHDSRDNVQRLLNSMAEGAYGVDANGNCTFVNRAFLQILSYQNEHELFGKGMHEIIHHSHSDGSPYPSSECKMYLAHKTNQRINASDEVFWRKDGVAVPVEYWSHPVVKDGVVIGSIATFVDITDRKRAENVLKDSESSLRYAQKIAKMGSWEWNMVTQETNWSDSYFAIHGFKPTEVEPSFELFRNRIHPEDVHLLDETHANIMKGRTPASFELRIIQPDGTVKWIQNNIAPVIEDDKLVGLRGVIIDVTERKLAEQERESLIRELKTALENVKTLGGLVPICASCKKIRDDKGYWNQLEKYLGDHTDAKLTHGLCPDCTKIYFPEAAAKAGL